MITYLGVDPGPRESAVAVISASGDVAAFHAPNDKIRKRCLEFCSRLTAYKIGIESVVNYGRVVGADVFRSCYEGGRIAQVIGSVTNEEPELVPVGDVRLHLCGKRSLGDTSIRAAVIDCFGGKEEAIGNKKNPGVLYGIKGPHCWDALALALYLKLRDEDENKRGTSGDYTRP